MLNKIALVRIIVFVLAWVNSFLVSKSLQPLPVLSENEIADLLAFGMSVWVLVKDNTLKK